MRAAQIRADVDERCAGPRNCRAWRIIALLGNMPPMGLAELAQRAGLDKEPDLSRRRQSCAAQIYIAGSDPDDNRAVRLSLADRGQALFEMLIEAAAQRNAVLLDDVPSDKRAVFLEVTERLIARARRMMEMAPER
jgi:DNA-binding MarR family transcriptional regulator